MTRIQALNQLAGIRQMVDRLEHTCTEDCDVTLEISALGEAGYMTHEQYHDEDKARDAILQDALEVSTRSNWASNKDEWEAEDYKILLSFGGPSVRIRGKLDEYQEPQTAQLEYQDWGTPWTRLPLTQEDIDALLTYAGCFYFGE